MALMRMLVLAVLLLAGPAWAQDGNNPWSDRADEPNAPDVAPQPAPEGLWQRVTGFIESSTGLALDTQVNVLLTLAVIISAMIIRRVVTMVINRRTQDHSKRYIAAKTVRYLLLLAVGLMLVRIWLGGMESLVTYLGILSAGLAIALQDPLTNLAGWLFLMVRKPFVVGDRIQIGERAGDVIDVSLFQFSLVEIGGWVDAEQSTGRVIHVPNGWVFKHSTYNYTQGFNFIWNELPVTVTFESDWRKAKEILLEIAEQHTAIKSEHAAQQVRQAAQKFLIYFEKLTPIVWTSVAENGVTLTIRYLCQPRNRRGSAERIWEAILDRFAEQGRIDFAYPTTRFYNNAGEGKPPTRPGQLFGPAQGGGQ